MLFLITLVFFILRITKTVDWEWKWIFAPLWIPIVIGFGLFILAAIVTLAFSLFAMIFG